MKVKSLEVGDMESNVWVSPEVQKRQQFKYYNNTYVYLSVREDFLSKED